MLMTEGHELGYGHPQCCAFSRSPGIPIFVFDSPEGNSNNAAGMMQELERIEDDKQSLSEIGRNVSADLSPLQTSAQPDLQKNSSCQKTTYHSAGNGQGHMAGCCPGNEQ